MQSFVTWLHPPFLIGCLMTRAVVNLSGQTQGCCSQFKWFCRGVTACQMDMQTFTLQRITLYPWMMLNWVSFHSNLQPQQTYGNGFKKYLQPWTISHFAMFPATNLCFLHWNCMWEINMRNDVIHTELFLANMWNDEGWFFFVFFISSRWLVRVDGKMDEAQNCHNV